MKLRYLYYLLSSILYVSNCFAQDIDSLYKNADNFWHRYATKYYNAATNVQTINNSSLFSYESNTKQGYEYFIIDASMCIERKAFDQDRFADSLSVLINKDINPYKLPIQNVRYNNSADTVYFHSEANNYSFDTYNYNIKHLSRSSNNNRGGGYWGNTFRENSSNRIASPDGTKDAYISEGNLWIWDRNNRKAKQLSFDGSPYEYYSSDIKWSPNSKMIVTCKYRPGGDRKLLLISSSPQDQLQPKTEEYDYPKPGDALPIKKPTLFNIENGDITSFDIPDVEKQYNLGNIKWHRDNKYFTFDFNKRGHQEYIIYACEPSGKTRKIVEEKSDTFIYYNMLYQHWMENSNEMLWISERDGWRHLYLYDTTKGNPIKQLTKGEWIVKRVIRVDEKEQKLIFIGCGMDKNEDPYLEKYYLLNINNGKITHLTPENANHSVTFSHDYKYMFDSYSRVDMPPVIAIRDIHNDGKIIFKPNNQPSISEAVSDGWQMPEVFSAKGRDGVTDIWGVIIRPSNFDPNKTYPVLEYIYAGPHDSHVPKRFAIEHTPSALAELGFITVMIDGMGTANRSKAFHDVCWKDLKDAGFPDRIKWMQSAAKKYPEMDISNVGIYGVSAGGQSAMGALLFHSDFYKVAVSSCGCHDNRLDKIWWNEQWMGFPIDNHYEKSSNVVNAHLLTGELMLILGELDNNVDPASTLRVVDELVKHDKEFEFVMLPNARHTMGEKYGERKRRDFFVKNILNKKIPNRNQNDK